MAAKGGVSVIDTAGPERVFTEHEGSRMVWGKKHPTMGDGDSQIH